MSDLKTIEAFLSKVVPNKGLVCIATPYENGGFRHKVVGSFAEAAGFADNLAAQGHDAYFALGSLKERRVWNEKEAKWQVRVGRNIAALKAFWFDIDIRPGKADHYAEETTALRALKDFCATTGLPKPLIVHSGGGLHVYWPLKTGIPADDWHRYATLLKGIARARNLLIDPTRTADRSSVLRVPGTGNFKKDQVRPVEIKVDAPEYDNAALLRVIEMAAEKFAVKDKTRVAALGSPEDIAEQMMREAAQIYDPTPADPIRVFRDCKQLRRVAALKGDVEEPVWYAALQICRFVENSSQVAHMVSSGHPQYDPDQTNAKLAQLEEKSIGPTTCARFDDLLGGICSKCPKNGQITTPLQLGRVIAEAPQEPVTIEVTTPTGEVVVEAEIVLPKPPAPFFRTAKNQIAVRILDGEGNDTEPKIIYEYDLYPSGRWYDEGAQKEYVTWRAWLPHDGWKEFDLETALLYDPRKLAAEIANRGIIPNIDNMGLVCRYMVTFLQQLQREAGTNKMYAQMGWRDGGNSFIMGETGIRQDGAVVHSAVSPAMQETKQGFSKQGSLEEWKKLVQVYNRKGCEPLAFAFLTYAAAPLLHFTNLDGLILAMLGESGVGKTSVMQAGNSIWGHPKNLFLNTNGSAIAIDDRIAGMNNLPVSLDEITNMAKDDPRKLSDICYGVSQGIGRSRLTQNGTQRLVKRWKTIMVTSTNQGLHNALQLAKGNSSAEALRVFEYEVQRSRSISKQEADTMLYGLMDHHGVAGVEYAKYLMLNKAAVQERVRKAQADLDKAVDIASQERYWSVLAALVFVAGEIFSELGLVEFNMPSIRDWFVYNLGILRRSVVDTAKGPGEVLADFLNEHHRGIIVTTRGDGRSKIPPKVEVPPSAPLIAQSIPEQGYFYLGRSAFKDYCTSHGHDIKVVERKLADSRILLDSGVKRCLGAGTHYATAQVPCWLIDAKHPDISGLNEIVAAEEKEVRKSA